MIAYPEYILLNFLAGWMWRVKLEYNNQGYPDTIEIGQVNDQSIDLATGKAFQWRGNGGKVIYYDSIEDCISTRQ